MENSAPNSEGLIKIFTNLSNSASIGAAFLIGFGIFFGMGLIFTGLFSMYKKNGRMNQSITWGLIGSQIGAGCLAIFLSFYTAIWLEKESAPKTINLVAVTSQAELLDLKATCDHFWIREDSYG